MKAGRGRASLSPTLVDCKVVVWKEKIGEEDKVERKTRRKRKGRHNLDLGGMGRRGMDWRVEG